MQFSSFLVAIQKRLAGLIVTGLFKRFEVHQALELAAYPNHVLRKHQKQIHCFREHSEFAALIDAEQFMLVTITTTAERREALIAEFDQDPWYPPCAVFDYPELCNLL